MYTYLKNLYIVLKSDSRILELLMTFESHVGVLDHSNLYFTDEEPLTYCSESLDWWR